MIWISLIILIIGSILCISGLKKYNEKEQEKKQLEEDLKKLQHEHAVLIGRYEIARFEQDKITKDIDRLKEIKKDYETVALNSFSNYCEVLDKDYEQKEKEYNQLIERLTQCYDERQQQLIEEIEQVRKELDKLANTRAAAIQAQLKEKEIKEQLSFYCIQIDNKDKKDVIALDKVKTELNTPRILSMLIWQTFFRDSMTTLCNNVLGPGTICGIYKITNQLTNECYIGQAVDIAKRWKDHAKCGLDIDRPQGNQLYQAMIRDGIWNFSWELLEKCPTYELNEKESFYIGLYQSKEYGYNGTKGNK